MGLFRQEYWSGFPCPPLGDLPDPGIKPVSLCWQVGATGTTWEARSVMVAIGFVFADALV